MDTASALNSAVTRRIFASSFLPADLPNYWNIVAMFAAASSRDRMQAAMLTTEVAKLTTENMQVLHPQAFMSDKELTLELIWMEYGQGKAGKLPLGIPSFQQISVCKLWRQTASQEPSTKQDHSLHGFLGYRSCYPFS